MVSIILSICFKFFLCNLIPTARAGLPLGQDISLPYLRPHPSKDDQIIQADRLLLQRLERIESYLQELAK